MKITLILELGNKFLNLLIVKMNLIISQGGCSSWGIMEWANNPFPVYINGMEYNAHTRDPNNISFIDDLRKHVPQSENNKILYVISNPYDYTIYCLSRIGKLPNWNIDHAKQTGSDYQYFVNNNPTLKQYLEDPYDAFSYKEHTEGYFNNKNRIYDLLFIKYDSLKNKKIMSEVKDFWGLGSSHPDFPYRERKSNWTSCSDEIKNLFDKKYGDLMNWYKGLPDIKWIKK